MTTTVEITEVVKKKIKELPPLPIVVHKLVKTLDDDNSSAEDVMKVLSSDQSLASKVLKLVNSSFYGMSGEISTPSRAVVILGFAAIRNLAIGLSAAKVMSMSDNDESRKRFWDHSIAAAAACQILAKRTGYPDPEEAFIAGLLHDIGQMVLTIAVPEDYAKVLADGPEHIVTNEEKIIGLSHAKAGQMLLKHWKLPRTLTQAVRFHHQPKIYCSGDDPLVALVALADAFASVHGAVYERSISTPEFLELIKVTGFDVETVGEVLTELDTRIEETRVFLQIATDEKVEAAQKSAGTQKRFVMICTEKVKKAWTNEVLGYFEHTPVSMKEFFEGLNAGDDVDFIILDPTSITAEQMQKITPSLKLTSAPIYLLGSDESGIVSQCLGRDLPELPLAFSREDLAR